MDAIAVQALADDPQRVLLTHPHDVVVALDDRQRFVVAHIRHQRHSVHACRVVRRHTHPFDVAPAGLLVLLLEGRGDVAVFEDQFITGRRRAGQLRMATQAAQLRLYPAEWLMSSAS